MLTLHITDRHITEAMSSLRDRSADPQPLFGQIGQSLVESTRLRFRDQQDPYGHAWKPLSPVTIQRRRKQGRGGVMALLDTGRLRNAIAYSTGPNHVLIGTNVIYGPTQHFGARKGQFGHTARGTPIPYGDIPARPFLGVSSEDKDHILTLIHAYLASP